MDEKSWAVHLFTVKTAGILGIALKWSEDTWSAWEIFLCRNPGILICFSLCWFTAIIFLQCPRDPLFLSCVKSVSSYVHYFPFPWFTSTYWWSTSFNTFWKGNMRVKYFETLHVWKYCCTTTLVCYFDKV